MSSVCLEESFHFQSFSVMLYAYYNRHKTVLGPYLGRIFLKVLKTHQREDYERRWEKYKYFVRAC